MSTELKSVSLVGFGIPKSNKKGDATVTLEDLKVVKAKAVKEDKPAKEEGPQFDFYWNAKRGMFNMKKSIVQSNPTDEHGFTFFYTEKGELLLIQSTKSNPVPSLRPKFLKGPRAANTFTSEFSEFMIAEMMFKDLNQSVTDGDFYTLGTNRYFTLTPVEAGDPNSTVFLVTENVWASKQPVPVEIPAEVTSDEVIEPVAEAEVAIETASVAEVTSTEPDYATEATTAPNINLDFPSIGHDAPVAQ